MQNQLMKEFERLIPILEIYNLKVLDEKDINHGLQLLISSEKQEIPLNIYFSQKKGVSHVIGGSPKNPLKTILQKILQQEIEENSVHHNWNTWIGSDESGKGDFFGSLVVAGFVCNKIMIPALKKIGVKDSKLLQEKEIYEITKALYGRFANLIEVVVLNPEKYNELYTKFRSQNKKLNELLAWMHARVVLNSYKKNQFEGALIDQFARKNIFNNSLKDINKIEIKTAIRGEDDIAVAAASIIARYHYLESMKRLSAKWSMEFPRGASEKVVVSGKEFIQKYGEKKINKVAKVHFVTLNKILESEK